RILRLHLCEVAWNVGVRQEEYTVSVSGQDLLQFRAGEKGGDESLIGGPEKWVYRRSDHGGREVAPPCRHENDRPALVRGVQRVVTRQPRLGDLIPVSGCSSQRSALVARTGEDHVVSGRTPLQRTR